MKTQSGFSFVEVLVATSIFALLSALLIAYNRAGEQHIAILKDQARAIGAILRAKSLAVDTYLGGGKVCGYGIHFEIPGDFIIFKDLAADCAVSDHKYSGEDENFEANKLSPNLKFSSLEVTDILFIPPDPKVILTPDKTSGIIAISTEDRSATVKIKVNDFGQVSSE